MNCNLLKEKLIDYIEGNLSKEEMEEVKSHLDNCPYCKKEYSELKETILYLQEKGEKIKIEKDTNLNPNKSKKTRKKSFKRIILIASVITIFIAFTAFASEIFDYISYWRESSIERTMAWDELIDNGLGEKLNISVEDNGIRVTAEGVIADDLNTLILLKVEDLNGDTTFSDDPYILGKYYEPEEILDEVEYIEVSGDIKRYDDNSLSLTTSSSLYQEEEGINKIIITTDAMNKEEGYINLKIREFKGINKDPMEIVKGNWDMKIEAKKLESYSYPIDEEIIVDGNQIKIVNIIIAPTETKVGYEYKTYNEEKDYYLKGLKFSIKHNGKIYESSKLGNSFINDFMTSDLPKVETSSLETLYLEKPEKIQLILNQYRYDTKNKKTYNLDIDNLPHELQYEDSRLILEDIIYTDESI